MFVDRTTAPDDADDADTLARDTLLHGGNVVVADELGVTDGVAGVLRYASH